MLSENDSDVLVQEDGSSIIMEHKPASVDSYFTKIVGHWNDSVHSIIKMSIELSNAYNAFGSSENKLKVLQTKLETSGIATKAQQKALIALANSESVFNYWKQCVQGKTKPSLPPDWKTLYQITQLGDDVFQAGIDLNIINAGSTGSDISKLKSGTHTLQGYKAPVKEPGLKGKVVAQVAIDFSQMETEAQAQELEEEITKAINKVANSYSFVSGKLTSNLTDSYKKEEERKSKGALSRQAQVKKTMLSLKKQIKDLKKGEALPVDKFFNENLKKFFLAKAA